MCRIFFGVINFLIFYTVPAGVFSQNAIIVEAESGVLNGTQISKDRPGYSGSGYVTGFDNPNDQLEVTFDVARADEYKIEISYANPGLNNTGAQLLLDNQLYGEVKFAKTDSFQIVNAATISLTTGSHQLRLQFKDAPIQPDYFVFTPLEELPVLKLDQPVVRIEAEDGILLGTRVEFGTPGFSGTGYVSNFDTPDDDKLRILVDVPEAKEYVVSIGFASPYGYKENYLRINNGPLQTIIFEQSEQFGSINTGRQSLKTGLNTLEIIHFWGWFELDYLEISQITGQAPMAKSQGNILLNDDLNDGQESVTLDGTASVDPDGDDLSFLWQLEDGSIVGTEAMFNYSFAIGTHQVTLTVTDPAGNSDVDRFVVIVADLANQERNRLSIRGGTDSLFMSGMNIAWTTGSNFAKDLINYNESTWITILEDIKRAGGNAMRWWLHTNGSVSPLFGTDGKVSGLRESTISNIRKVLDLAYKRGIMVSLCLWSFDMLQEQGQNLDYTRKLLEDSSATLAYINNALIPMVIGLKAHPAIMTWEIFNEPEGMTIEYGWSAQRTTMFDIQKFVNRCAGAIHRTDPDAIVSNGSASFETASDINGSIDYYRDDRLREAGGDADGTLDLIQVHYYDHFGIEKSPFHFPASYWQINKPIIIGEFPSGGIVGFTSEECYQYAYQLGYAGAMAWSYSDTQFGGFPAARPGMGVLYANYPEDIIVPDTNSVTTIWQDDLSTTLQIYPNPVANELHILTDREWSGKATFQIYNTQGQLLQRGMLPFSNEQTIAVNELRPGQYIVRIHDLKLLAIKRFVKI
ncbi:MAG: T9SS type A sorting domain-containing protein [Saprospiraceae bacterium]|nr:T9SS type A sorting domain-containing protein [Saprospiraceae bacterium]